MKFKYPFLVIFLISASAAAALFLFGLGRERRSLGVAGRTIGGDKVAIVEITGLLTSSHDVGDRSVSARRIVEQLEKYGEDEAVKAIVLRVDTPGGTVVAAQEIHGAVMRLRTEKKIKVVISMADVAASGGYYIACAGDRIFANPGTLTGSIGVIMQFPNFQGLLGKIGVSSTTIKSGEFKDIGNSFRPMTNGDRIILQKLIDDVYGQFVEAVAKGRGMTEANVREIADGRICSGKQALKANLVDELGDLDAAVKAAAKLAGITGKPQILREKPKNKLLELLDSRMASLFPMGALADAEFSKARLLFLWQ
jgi:protease-4